mgnify:FL=1
MLVDAGRSMLRRGLTVGTWGNVSVRDAETGNIYITPSGMNYDTCCCDDMVVYDADGNPVKGDRAPSIEKNLHISVYRARRDVNAVVHTHPLYSTVFAVTGESIPPITDDFVQSVGKTVSCAEYALPGTEALAENAVRALGSSNAVILTSHGTVCVGPSLESAMKVVDVVEKTAAIAIFAKLFGSVREIPDHDIAAMQEFVRTKYGQRPSGTQ